MITMKELEAPVRQWVPDWLGLISIFIVILPVTMLNGSYTGSMLEVSNTLGTNSEDITMGYYAASAGMAIAYPIIPKVLAAFSVKSLLLIDLVLQFFLSWVCARTQNADILIVCSFAVGFLKGFLMLWFIRYAQKIFSPKNVRSEFYSYFYPLVYGGGQASMLVTALLAYHYNWKYMYYFMMVLILISILFVIICFRHNRPIKAVAWSDLHIREMFVISAGLLMLMYVINYGKVLNWMASGKICAYIIIAPMLIALFIWYQSEVSKNEFIRHKYSTRFLSIKLLENDPDIERIVRTLPNADEIFHVRDKMSKRVQDTMNEDCESAITDAKYGFISGALKETFTDNHLEQAQTTKVLDSIVTHRVWGFPIFFLFMYLMFEGTFVIGEYPMMGIEWLVEQIGDLLRNNMAEGPFKDLLIDGIIGGVGAVIVFLPNILILYFCISLMEDSGYMARAAFIMDKIMHKMGLHGKSFIPLIMGFGCNVPAIIASRTIENRKSRLITMLVNPLMSCSARLPIYLLLVGAFFPNNASLVLLSIYVIGIVLAVVMARLFSKFLVKGDDTPFVMELPPYRMPTAKSIFRHTWEKGAQYLKKMGGIIMIASIIIWFLGYYPNHDAYETVAEQQENSYIGQLGRGIEPVIKPLGFDWKLGIGLLSGVGAKELVVSTLGVLYADDPDADSVSLAERIPITPLVAFCYMLFVLIYFPCIAAIAAIKQESGSWKWALFAACYTTGLAWLVSFAVYQIGGLFV